MKQLYFGMHYNNELVVTAAAEEIQGIERQVKVVFAEDGFPVSVELVNDQNTNH